MISVDLYNRPRALRMPSAHIPRLKIGEAKSPKKDYCGRRTKFPFGGTHTVLNRRTFLQLASSATAGGMLGARVHALPGPQQQPAAPVSANDHIQIALIGAGGQGMGDTRVALQVPGVKLVAVSDCYD